MVYTGDPCFLVLASWVQRQRVADPQVGQSAAPVEVRGESRQAEPANRSLFSYDGERLHELSVVGRVVCE